MLKKLKSVLKTHKGLLSILALKALIFSGLLYASSVVSRWLLVVFLLVSFYFYFRSFFNTRQFLASFLTLFALSLLFVDLSVVGRWSSVVGLFFGFLFFLLLGIKDLIFIRREPLYYLLNSLLLLTVFVYFFSFNDFYRPFRFLVNSLAAFSAVFFLFKEFLAIAVSVPLGNQKRNLMAVGSAFLSLQFLWVVAFLPFRSLNAASLALLIALILEDFIVHHLSGTINRRIVLRNVTMFLILAMIIFGASKWTP